MSDEKLAIGIDIGGTNTVFGIVNHRGNIKYRGALSTTDYETADDFVKALKKALKPAIEELGGKKRIQGVGIGAPNGNFYSGTIEYAPNLKWKGVIPLAEMVSKAFHLPAALTNDANAAAVGEMMYGAARGMKDFIMITLGTGVGSGIVANGQLILGNDGFAGELGHVIVVPEGRYHPGTGFHGSLETYASATGVVRTAQELLSNTQEESLLRKFNIEQLTSKQIYEAAIQDDLLAKAVYEYTGKILGEALANFVMFSSPQAIVLFGGLTKAGKMLSDPVKHHMEKNVLPIFRDKVKIIFSELNESDAAILGASALVWEIKQ